MTKLKNVSDSHEEEEEAEEVEPKLVEEPVLLSESNEGEVDDVIEAVGIGLGFGGDAGTGRAGESAVLTRGGEADPRVKRKRGGIDFPAAGLGRGGWDGAGGSVGELSDG